MADQHTHTVFSDKLRRHGRNDWRWPDGTPEPRVRDMSPDRADKPVVGDSDI